MASGEINSEVADQAAATAKVRAEFASRPGVTLDELDGLTVTGDGWWFNLRPSNTEPLLRLNVEAADDEELCSGCATRCSASCAVSPGSPGTLTARDRLLPERPRP